MKRLILLIFICLFAITGCKQYKYGSGLDTYGFFGDGRYQIIKSEEIYNNGEILRDLILTDMAGDNNGFIDLVYIWKDYSPQYVYAIGYHGYTKLDYKTGEYQQSMDVTQFNDDDQEIFSELGKSKEDFMKKNKIKPPSS